MTRDIEKLDCLTEAELASLVACDQALQAARARLSDARNQVKALARRLAESEDLDISALAAELSAATMALGAFPIEIGALTRRRVLLHLGAIAVQRERQRAKADVAKAELDRHNAENARIEKTINGMVRPPSGYPSMSYPGKTNPEHVARQAEAQTEFDTAFSALHRQQQALRAPSEKAYREYHQADTMATACDSWAADYGRIGGAPDLVCSLDQPSSWGPVAFAQGELAQKALRTATNW